jgi:serine/threonine protein kinase
MAGQVYVKLGQTFLYQPIAENVVGRGAHGKVFAGHFKPNLNTSWGKGSGEVKQAAIKRVEINFNLEKWANIAIDREVVALKELRHPCIVRLFAVEDDDNFRYSYSYIVIKMFFFFNLNYISLPIETTFLNCVKRPLKISSRKNMTDLCLLK